MQIQFHSDAEAELVEAALFYENKVNDLPKPFTLFS